MNEGMGEEYKEGRIVSMYEFAVDKVGIPPFLSNVLLILQGRSIFGVDLCIMRKNPLARACD